MAETSIPRSDAEAAAQGGLAALWARLTEPHASIRAPERRRRARALSGLLIVAISLGLLALAITLGDLAEGRGDTTAIWQVLAPMFLLCGVYLLSRGRRATLAAILTVAILLTSAVLAAALAPQETETLGYLLLAGLVSGLLFSAPVTAIVFALTLASVLLFPALQPSLPAAALVNVGFLIVAVASLMVVTTSIRDRDVHHIEIQSQRLETREALLEDTAHKLRISVKALEQRNREGELLVEMSRMLQVCSSIQEAVELFIGVGRRMFPEAIGCVYLFRASRDVVERVGRWGPDVDRTSLLAFTLQDCMGLRLGKPHRLNSTEDRMACAHLPQPPPDHSLCVPLLAQAEVLGLFHLRWQADPTGESEQPVSEEGALEREQLAIQLADQFSLALSNLNLRERLRHESIVDPLTGLFNRRYLDVTLERELQRAQRNERPLAVIMFDLDHFKRLNDTYGHAAGDAALRVTGGFLEAHVRGGDIACRFGGEEFALILPEVALQAAAARAAELVADVRHLRLQHQGVSLPHLTMSGGVAVFPGHGTTAQELLRLADHALYQAKAQGRDQVVVAEGAARAANSGAAGRKSRRQRLASGGREPK